MSKYATEGDSDVAGEVKGFPDMGSSTVKDSECEA